MELLQKRFDSVSCRDISNLFGIDLGGGLNILLEPTLVVACQSQESSLDPGRQARDAKIGFELIDAFRKRFDRLIDTERNEILFMPAQGENVDHEAILM